MLRDKQAIEMNSLQHRELYLNNWNATVSELTHLSYEKKYLTLDALLYIKLKPLKSSICCVFFKTVAQRELFKITTLCAENSLTTLIATNNHPYPGRPDELKSSNYN